MIGDTLFRYLLGFAVFLFLLALLSPLIEAAVGAL
jgi:hypothetical protein